MYETLLGRVYPTFDGADAHVVWSGCFHHIRILSAATNSQVGFASNIIVPPLSRTDIPFASIVTWFDVPDLFWKRVATISPDFMYTTPVAVILK